ncbi:MAG TPA: hypothetical protein V6C89_04575 [Drouetiella sp.]
MDMPSAKQLPPMIRKSCFLLGVNPKELTVVSVNEAWKKLIGEDSGEEVVAILTGAKNSVIEWIKGQQGPGSNHNDDNPRQPSGAPRY